MIVFFSVRSRPEPRNLLLWFLVFLYTVVVWVKLVCEKKRVCLFIRKEKKCVLASYTKMCFSRTVLIHLISQDINPLLSVRITPARESPFYWKQVSFRFVYSVCCWLFLKKRKENRVKPKLQWKTNIPKQKISSWAAPSSVMEKHGFIWVPFHLLWPVITDAKSYHTQIILTYHTTVQNFRVSAI